MHPVLAGLLLRSSMVDGKPILSVVISLVFLGHPLPLLPACLGFLTVCVCSFLSDVVVYFLLSSFCFSPLALLLLSSCYCFLRCLTLCSLRFVFFVPACCYYKHVPASAT